MLPTDQQLELEFWTETGEFDNTELHEVWGLRSLVRTVGGPGYYLCWYCSVWHTASYFKGGTSYLQFF